MSYSFNDEQLQGQSFVVSSSLTETKTDLTLREDCSVFSVKTPIKVGR